MRKGDHLSVRCAGLDVEGAGVGVMDGVRVHVAGALPGEAVRAQVAHVSPHRPEAWATLQVLEERSPARTEPVCPAYGACGGCVLEHLRYDEQRAWKSERVKEELQRGKHLRDVAVGACVASPRPLGYRNRSKLVYGRIDGRPALGAFAPRSHRLVDMQGCHVAEAPLDEVARELLAVLVAEGIEPYDEQTGAGELRYAILRVSHTRAVLVTLVTPQREWPKGAAVARALMERRPDVVGVAQNVNPSRGNALFGREDLPLAGAAWLDDQVGGVHVRLSPTAFFQLNRDIAERLYADVLAATSPSGSERVVDCYAGVGGVALTLAAHAGEVIAIEDNPRAVEDALASAHLNLAGRVRFWCGDVAVKLGEIQAADVIVLNPPRRGCTPEVLDAVTRLRPRVIAYVSCSPDTLARDLDLLAERGFVTRSVRPYDMLPQTPHVEALAVIEPKSG